MEMLKIVKHIYPDMKLGDDYIIENNSDGLGDVVRFLKENIELTENEIQDAIIYITDEENKKNRIEEINSKIETTIHKLNTLSLFSKISNQEIKIFLTNKLESEILVLKNTIEEKLENIVSEYGEDILLEIGNTQ